jgi:hypothetical protein
MDRKDSSFGYTKDNIQWVHKHINLIKSALEESLFYDMCSVISHNFINLDTDSMLHDTCVNRKKSTHKRHPSYKDREECIQELILVHGDLLDYSKVVYKNMRSKIEVVCKICGVSAWIKPYNLRLRKTACLNCRKLESIEHEKILKDKAREQYFIKKELDRPSKERRKKEKHELSIVRAREKLEQGKQIRRQNSQQNKLMRTNQLLNNFIKKAKEKHGDKYDYSITAWNGYDRKIKIICNTCKNIFEQRIDNHLVGSQCCPFCNSWNNCWKDKNIQVNKINKS